MTGIWWRDKATAIVATGAAAVATIALVVTMWFVLPRAGAPDGASPTSPAVSRAAMGPSGPKTTAPTSRPVVPGPVSTTPPATKAPGRTTTFRASADAYIQVDQATTNFGTADRIMVDSGPKRRSLVKVTVTGLTGKVTRAVLRLHTVADSPGSNNGGTWRAMDDTSWSETSVAWTGRPAMDGEILDALGAVKRNTWYEVDVTAIVTGDATYSFAGVTTNGDGVSYDSREAGRNGPQLVITTAPA